MRTRPPSLGLVADRRFREAAHTAAPGLDVRGPISEAMGRAGLALPALDAGPMRAEPAPTSGLTADERRVHRILLDSLARLNAERNGGLGGLSYAERKRLEALDLAFIDAELARMTRRREGAAKAITWGIGAGMIVLPLVVLAVILTGAVDAMPVVLGLLVALTAAGAGLAALAGVGGATSPRQQVYEALRELALVADAGEATSAALLEADLLIDRLADDEAAHATAAPRARVRS